MPDRYAKHLRPGSSVTGWIPSYRLYPITSSGIGGPYWLTLFGNYGATGSEDGRGVTVDTSGNVFVGGNTDIAGYPNNMVAKWDASANLAWQYRWGPAGTFNQSPGWAITSDLAGNVYILGESNAVGYGGIYPIVTKYNNAGVYQWRITLTDGANPGNARGITTDASGNIYVGGWGNNRGQLWKLDSTGAVVFTKSLYVSASSEYYTSIAVDASGNIYLGGYFSSTGIHMLLLKYSSTGAFIWGKSLGTLTTGSIYEQFSAIAVDISGNIFAVGYSNVTGNNDMAIAKYNSSGTLLWQRRLYSAADDTASGVAVDSAGNAYMVGQSATTGNSDMIIAKYNTSGVIQWQRRISSTAADVADAIAIDISDNIYVSGYSSISGNADVLLAKLLPSGSQTGTYTVGAYSFTIAASTLTDAAGAYPDNTFGITTEAAGAYGSVATFATNVTTTFVSTTATL